VTAATRRVASNAASASRSGGDSVLAAPLLPAPPSVPQLAAPLLLLLAPPVTPHLSGGGSVLAAPLPPPPLVPQLAAPLLLLLLVPPVMPHVAPPWSLPPAPPTLTPSPLRTVVPRPTLSSSA